METLNSINGIITLLIFIYAIYIFPKAMGEIKGVYMETPDEFFGKFKEDCKWTHGTTYGIGALSYILIVFFILIWNQINNTYGIVISNVFLIIILILLKIFYDKRKVINAELAYKKNIEDGYLKETDPIPNQKGRLRKLYEKILKKE